MAKQAAEKWPEKLDQKSEKKECGTIHGKDTLFMRVHVGGAKDDKCRRMIYPIVGIENRLTHEQQTQFENLCELQDYADYVEEMVSSNEMPLILQEWRKTER